MRTAKATGPLLWTISIRVLPPAGEGAAVEGSAPEEAS